MGRLLDRLARPQAYAEGTLEEMLRRHVRPTASGVTVTPDSALRVSAVFACVGLIAEDLAKLPLNLHRRLPNGGKEKATDHRLHSIVHDTPNEWQTSFELREMVQAHAGLRGNGFGILTKVGREIREIIPVHPDRMQVSQAADYTIRYKLDGEDFPADRVFHLRDRSLDGVVGISRISYAREAIGLSAATESHGGRVFANGARPGLVAVHPKTMNKGAQERLKESIEAATSRENQHRLLVLEEDLKIHQVGLSNEDTQFLETRQFQLSEIARFYRVPPHKIQDLARSTNNNIEHQGLEYVTDCLQPWACRWEQALGRALLSREERKVYFFKFNFDALLRGDAKSRGQFYKDGILTGWMNRNEARDKEDMNPAEGLDEYLQPLNMAPSGTEVEEE